MTLRQFVSVKMSASVLHVAERLIGWEAERSNVKRVVAREIVAREAGISPGSIERLQTGRLKFVDRIAGRLNELLERKLERKIAELEHELAALKAIGREADQSDLLAAADAVEKAKRLIGKA